MIDKVLMCKVKPLGRIASGAWEDDEHIRNVKGGVILFNKRFSYLCGGTFPVIKLTNEVSIMSNNGNEIPLNLHACEVFEVNTIPTLFDNLTYVVFRTHDMLDASKVISYGIDNGYTIMENSMIDGAYHVELRKIPDTPPTQPEDCKIKERRKTNG